MSVAAGSMFKWLDLLEKEFDRSFVQLDLLLGDIDPEQEDLTNDGRDRLGVISSCFSQLCHKAQTLAQMNAKLEAEIVNLRTELFTQTAQSKTSDDESEKLVLQLHREQLKSLNAQGVETKEVEDRLNAELEEWRTDRTAIHQAKVAADRFELENRNLQREMLSLQDDLFGARLASKYLDKELAGRIQQIQLLGRDIRGNDYERVWNQLEAEIHLHRHKTVIRACRAMDDHVMPAGHEPGSIGMVRRVVLHKDPEQGLGLAVVGGKQLGVPILVSEIYANRPAAISGQVFIGDAILSVNNLDLRNLKHEDAVAILNEQKAEVELELLFVSPDDKVSTMSRTVSKVADMSTSTQIEPDELPDPPCNELDQTDDPPDSIPPTNEPTPSITAISISSHD